MKKGFTLVEILGVITLIGILSLIAVPIINGVIDDSKEKLYLRQINLVKEAASKYMVENSNLLPDDGESFLLTFEDLKKSSHLDNEDIIDPRNDKEIVGCFNVTYSVSKEKYQYKFLTGNACISPEEYACSGELTDEVNWGNGIEAYVSGTTLCLQGTDEYETVQSNYPTVWGELAVELTSFLYERNDYYFQSAQENSLFSIKYLAYYDTIGWNALKNGDDTYLDDVESDVELGIIQIAETFANDPIFEDFSTSIPYQNILVGEPGEIRDFYPGENLNFLSNIERVEILGGISRIGNNAFSSGFLGEGCYPGGLINGVLIHPDVTTIGKYAFFCNQLEDIDIPDHVTSIDKFAFAFNPIFSLNLSNELEEIGDEAFANTNIEGSLIIPNRVTTIGDAAFISNSITNLVIPDSVTVIGDSAFAYNQISSAILSDNLISIGAGAFSTNDLSNITIPNGVITLGGFEFNNLLAITIPSTVTTIKEYAFSSNDITSLIIPNSVTTIGGQAFSWNNLQSVSLSNNLTSIGYYAFSFNNLSTITIPGTVTTIETYAFDNNQLTSIKMPSGVSIANNMLKYNNNDFRIAYVSGGAGTYIGTQIGTWTKQ